VDKEQKAAPSTHKKFSFIVEDGIDVLPPAQFQRIALNLAMVRDAGFEPATSCV
jgi:hypothetical protein